MIWFLVNLLCLFLYFVCSSFLLFFIYYLNFLPCTTKIRYGFSFLDFYLDTIKMLAYDYKHRIPDAFCESGIVIYEGPQGSGKTISMIHDIMVLQLNNGPQGVITSLDELGIWFNARKFKEFDNSMLQVIFENRKCRRLLMGTVQKFLLCDKNLRIQVSEIRRCHTVGPITYYFRLIPVMDSEGSVQRYQFKGFKIFVQSSDLRDAYDTYHVIKKYDLS